MAAHLSCESVASPTCGTSEVEAANDAYIETPISSPSKWLIWDQPPDNPECTEENDSFHNEEVPPFSSSPPDFGISSTCSSCFSGSGATSLTSAPRSLSNLSRNSGSSNAACTSDKFTRELHVLFLKAQQECVSVDRTGYSFYSDASLMRTPEFTFPSDLENDDEPVLFNLTSQHSSFSSSKHVESFSENTDAELRKSSHSHSENGSFGSFSESTVSPIKFENRLPLLSSHESVNKNNPILYRIIKRAQSCSGDGISGQDGEPPKKRIKQGRAVDFHVRDRIYARRSASLRRADSLQSCNGDEQEFTPFGLTTKGILTIPSTPRPRNAELAAVQANTPSPVPIIAPPSDHIPNLPLSCEAVAKIRVMRLLEREESGRQTDGLSPGICKRPPHWMLPETGDANPIDIDSQSSIEDDIRFDWEVVMGLGSKRRRSIVDWLLHVLPIRSLKVPGPSESPSPPSSISSSGSSASTFSTESTQLEHGDNLFDQLENSPDTRFHAVWMFLRFFYLMMPHDMLESNNEKARFPKTSISHTSKTLQQDGLALVAWDVAVACLSLSVKFHRDFLNPLHPVYAHEYLALAPHILTHEDLESAHRDVLAAFDYRLGITPQAILDLLWLSLPSLRSLFEFDGGWQKTQQGTWTCLFNFLSEPDVQRFPISVLTSVSLMDSISECLIKQYRHECLSDDISYADLLDSPKEDTSDIRAVWDECQRRVQDDIEGVFCDIQALIGLTDAQLQDCRLWITCID